jgi:hypothetical protein
MMLRQAARLVCSLCVLLCACSSDGPPTDGPASGGSAGTAGGGAGSGGSTFTAGGAGSGGAAGSGAGAMATAGSAGSNGNCGAGCVTLCEAGICSCACGASCEAFATPPFDKSCTTDDDCFAGIHTLDCCGSQVVLGYNVSARPSFDGYETDCSARAVCRCAPDEPTIEGGQVTSDIDLRRAICSAGQCLGTGPVYAGDP